MNTADRSVEAIDTALRRRFCFEEMSPLYDLDELNYEIAVHNVGKILFTINKRIEKLLDKDHTIGHSYFIRKIDETPEEKLLNSFYHNIIPLLQEYFFGDFGKIGLVLGQGFVRMKEWNKNSDSFADFDYESASEFEDRPVYEIIDYRIEQDGIRKFLVAVKRLMNDKIE
jgi:5-methylcytosine-specific restriction protein B